MKQKFRFAELYKNNRTAVEKTLAAMWCGEARNESQKGYINQLKMIIPEVFAPKGCYAIGTMHEQLRDCLSRTRSRG